MRIKVLFPLLTLLAPLHSAKPVPIREAETQILEAYEDRDPLPRPAVAPAHRRTLRWIQEAASREIPSNPFPKGSPAWTEAEALRRLHGMAPEQWAQALASQPTSLSGTGLALWRWGQARARNGRLNAGLRARWEDRLLAGPVPALVFENALRHALCFALAEADETRFAALKNAWSESTPDLFLDFQRAFALLGAPSPAFTLWSLPDLSKLQCGLGDLKARSFWIAAAPQGPLPDLPEGTAWIVPTRTGVQPEEQMELVEPSLGEARTLAERLRVAGRTAYLAPVRKPFQTYALVFFPIRVELGEGGAIHRIRMGDAALAKGD